MKKTRILAISVRNVFHLWESCINIGIPIKVNLNAQNIYEKGSADKIILQRKHLNALFVENDSQQKTRLLYTAEFMVERNHTNVTCVTKRLKSLEI